MKLILDFLSRRSPFSISLTTIFLMMLIGYLDYITGTEISISVLYILPVTLMVWCVNRGAGIITSIVVSVIGFFADFLAGVPYSHPIIHYWNSLMLFCFYLIFSYTLSQFKRVLTEEMRMSRTDILTGLANRRHFFELAEMETNRAARYHHPFSVVYIDLDNFKYVNDHLGHNTGDEVLRVFSKVVSENLRVTDVFARMGGDEFAIILPETEHDAAVRKLIEKIQDKLLGAMKENRWPITFSIGVVIYMKPPSSIDEMIQIPDNLMYSVKKSGKNMAKFEVFK